jgi:acyl-coenzyme A synthetase/AMP-(fatty) acid ligase
MYDLHCTAHLVLHALVWVYIPADPCYICVSVFAFCAPQVVGEGRCPIVDTWWQTETGASMIAPMPFAWECKPGSATLPFFGVHPVLLTDKGEEIHGPGRGCHLLVMRSFL